MTSDIKHRAKFDFVRYASVWEDADILCEALQPNQDSTILSISSGGDNALALLADGAKVLALDLSQAQLACLELKLVAFQHLSYEEVLEFLGVLPSDKRWEIYKDLKQYLSAPVVDYWDAQPDAIRAGINHCGKFEKFFGHFRTKLLPLIHSQKCVDDLLQKKSLAEQKQFFDERWNNWRWRALFQIFFSRFVLGRLGRDPEFFRYVEGSVADQLLARAAAGLTEVSTHDNPYLEYILKGNYINAYPRYLRKENYQKIRDNAGNLVMYHGSIEQAIAAHPEMKFTGFNLSDIFEYLNPDYGKQICQQLVAASQKGARLAYWNMLVPRRFSQQMSNLHYLEDLSKQLFAKDKAFFYNSYIVEEVRNVGE